MSRYEQNPASAKSAIIDAYAVVGERNLLVPDVRTQLLFVWMLVYTGTWTEGNDLTPSDLAIQHGDNVLLSVPITAIQKQVICVSRPLSTYVPLEVGGSNLTINLRNSLGTDGFYVAGVGSQTA